MASLILVIGNRKSVMVGLSSSVHSDSHVKASYSLVAKNLGTKASTSKFTTSRCLGDPFYLDHLELVLKQFRFDVISFNNGLHGRGYSEEQYKE